MISASLASSLKELRTSVASNSPVSPSLISSIKLALSTEGLLPPFSPALLSSPGFSSAAAFSRDFFEFACFAAINAKDLPAFSRQFSQLRAFYFDYSELIQPSPNQPELIGLHLLSLIAQTRVSEFHTEIEFIANQQKNSGAGNASSKETGNLKLQRSISSSNSAVASEFIQFPITLEQQLMEGAYNQVVNSRAAAPSNRFHYFLSLLSVSVREKIAKCAESAFDEFPLSGIQSLLLFSSVGEANEWVAAHGWKKFKDQHGTEIVKFIRENEENAMKEGDETSKSMFLGQNYQTIAQTLKFATELEKII